MYLNELKELLTKAVVLHEDLAEMNGQEGDDVTYDYQMNDVCEVKKFIEELKECKNMELYFPIHLDSLAKLKGYDINAISSVLRTYSYNTRAELKRLNKLNEDIDSLCSSFVNKEEDYWVKHMKRRVEELSKETKEV